jgi:DNA repair exonuclease SbcCD nuclease subunit
MAVKILATADNHLGFRQYGLVQRERDIEDSFKNILELAVRENADAITVSGDIIHSIRPTAATISFLKDCNTFLEENKLPCLVSIGNHDLSKPHWLTNINTSDKYGFIVLDNELFDVSGVNIFGATFSSRDEFEQGKNIPRESNLVLMHQPFEEFANFPNDKLFTCDDLMYLPKDALVVVGDIHVNRTFKCPNAEGDEELTVISPGSTELISESEQNDKYVVKLEFTQDRVETANVPIKIREILRLEVRNEKDFENCVSLIKEKEALAPLVFLKFSTTVENVMTRLRTIFDISKLIIRPKPIVEYNGEEVVRGEDGGGELTVADVLADIMPTNSPTYALTTRLLDPEADVHSVVDAFVDTRLKELDDDRS